MKTLSLPTTVLTCLLLAGCGQQSASFDFVDDGDFEKLISSTPVVVVNFTADW